MKMRMRRVCRRLSPSFARLLPAEPEQRGSGCGYSALHLISISLRLGHFRTVYSRSEACILSDRAPTHLGAVRTISGFSVGGHRAAPHFPGDGRGSEGRQMG